MLEIVRVGWATRRYTVREGERDRGMWVRRRFGEEMAGEVDGDRYEFKRVGRRRFTLVHAGTTLASAEAGRGEWTIRTNDAEYALRRRSMWRSDRELFRVDGPLFGPQRRGRAVGSIRRVGPRRVLCELPAELSPARQAFIGFLVLTLWNRDNMTTAVATSGGGAAGAVAM